MIILIISWNATAFAQCGGVSPDHITLTWTGDTSRTMTITWRTNTSISAGYVQYERGDVVSSSAPRVKASLSAFRTNMGTSHLFSATLTGLSPGTTYSYKVGEGTHWSGTHSFTTANPKAHHFKFLVFGDSQSSSSGNPPYKSWMKTVHNAFNANPDARFMINLGDLVDTGQSNAHWNGWFNAAEGVIDTIPEMPVLGNHETYGDSGKSKPEYFNAQFHLPQNGPEGLKNQVYSFDYASVHFAVLDSQQSEEHAYGNILTPQRIWLESDLAASKAKWKIVLFHKPPYGLTFIRSNSDVKSAFCSVIENQHADVVFNGHDHGVGRTYPMMSEKRMQKPSQGTIYYITGRSGSKAYVFLQKMDWDSYFYNPQSQPNYMVVDVDDLRMEIKAYKQDGTLLDSFFIDKKTDQCGKSPK